MYAEHERLMYGGEKNSIEFYAEHMLSTHGLLNCLYSTHHSNSFRDAMLRAHWSPAQHPLSHAFKP